MLKSYTTICAFLAVVITACVTGLTSAQRPISDEAVKGAILCWNEASGNRFDCAAIVGIRMRSARAHGRTFGEELVALHGDGREHNPAYASLRSDRATNPRADDRRPWLGDITLDLHQPRGWPENDAPWPRYAARFAILFRFVQDVLDGNERDRCHGTPIRWGGARIDAHHIERMRAAGHPIIDCGDTHNVYLGRE